MIVWFRRFKIDTRTTVASYLPIGAWRHYVQLCVGRYLLYPFMRFVLVLLVAMFMAMVLFGLFFFYFFFFLCWCFCYSQCLTSFGSFALLVAFLALCNKIEINVNFGTSSWPLFYCLLFAGLVLFFSILFIFFFFVNSWHYQIYGNSFLRIANNILKLWI